MKKFISYLLTLALFVPAFVSCTQERDFLPGKQKTHTVHFATSEPTTRTGLSIEENMVKPNWRKTDLENIHFFEIDAANAAAPGTADEINLSDDNRTAHFKAAISDDMTIIVSPSEGDNGSKGVKSAGVSPFTFAAVVAQMPDKDAYTFVIPSEQHPDAETLKDPNAEFLVGYSRKSYADQYDYDDVVVDLYFDRVAALGRLAISGFVGTGETVKSVTITADGGLTGKATYPGDFTLGDKNKVNFTKVDEPLVLNYGENGVAAPAEGAFYAYFVTVPDEASITSIEVLTDQYRYTKTVEGGASFTFSDEQLLNIAFALSEDIAESVTADNNTWYKASVLEAGYDYLIVSGGQALKNNGGEIDVLAVEPQDGVITFESSTDPTIVWTAKAHVEYYDENDTKPAGHYTLSQGEGDATLYFERYSDKQTQNGSIVSAPTEDTNGNYKYYVWEYDGEHFYQISRDGDDGVYCLTYNSGWKFEYQSKPNTYLYTNRPPIEISFASAEAKYDLDNEEWTVAIPELTAPEGAVVTYSSSNEDIATVAADGTVMPKAAGSVRITATVEGNDEHQGGSAYYELTVTTSKITTKRYVLANTIEAGKEYLIISNGFALKNSGNNGSTQAVNPQDGVIEFDLDYDFTGLLWTVTREASLPENGDYTLKNGTKYIRRPSGGGTTLSLETEPSSFTKYFVWLYDGTHLYHHNIGGSDGSTKYVYWLHYDGGWKFAYAATTDPSHNSAKVTQLYVEEDGGTTPPTPEKQERNLTFGTEGVSYTIGQTTTLPTLSGVTEGVEYSSSNTSVATVNAQTGAVEVLATGTTIIKAEAAEDDNYLAGSAQYTLTVNPASGETVTVQLKKATRITSGKQYVLVSNGKALVRNGEATSAADFNSSNLTVTLPNTSEPNLWWTLGTTTDSNNRGNIYQFTNGGYYFGIVMDQTNTAEYTYHIGVSTTTSNVEGNSKLSMPNHNIDLEQGYIFYKGNSKSQYIYFDESSWNNHQESNGTFIADYKTTLYVLDDGTPDPTTTYYLASSIEAGKQYLIVSNGKALQNNGGTAAAIDVTVSDGAIQLYDDDAVTALWTATASSGKFTLGNSGRYLYRSSSTISLSTSSVTWSCDSNGKLTSGSSSTYYLYWSTNNSKWSASTTESDAHTALLYTTDPGSNPGGGDDPEPQTQFTYTQITSVSELTDGASYLIVSGLASSSSSSPVSTYAHKYILMGTKDDGSVVEVSPAAVDGVITGAYSDNEFVLTKIDDNNTYSFHGKSGYLYWKSSGSNRYIGMSSNESDSNLRLDPDHTKATGNEAAFFFGAVKSNSTTISEFLYLNSDQKFKIGATGSNCGVYLYKKVETP